MAVRCDIYRDNFIIEKIKKYIKISHYLIARALGYCKTFPFLRFSSH